MEFEEYGVTYWTLIGFPATMVMLVLIGKRLGSERVREIWDSDRWSRLIGLGMIILSGWVIWALAILPIQYAIRTGKRELMIPQGLIVIGSIVAQVGLIALTMGASKDRWLHRDRSQPMTSEQSTVAAIIIGVGFAVLFVVTKTFGLRPGV